MVFLVDVLAQQQHKRTSVLDEPFARRVGIRCGHIDGVGHRPHVTPAFFMLV